MRLLGVLRHGWERFSIYLPVMLMALLALGTYWLVRNTPILNTPGPTQPLRHDPDYFMKGFSVKTFNATGRLKNEIEGTEARHFPDTDTLEVDQVRMRSFDEQGHPTVSTANRALSNSDGSEVQLFGNAVVVREAVTDAAGQVAQRLELRSEFLHAFSNTERVRTHKPVTLLRGEDRFTADSMDYDNLDRVMQLDGRVRGMIASNVGRSAK